MENVRVHKLNHARRGEGVVWGTLLKAIVTKINQRDGLRVPSSGEHF